MVAEQMRKLFAFNSWAWERVYASVDKLDDEAYHKPRQLFEGSIHGTLVHCLTAEFIWFARIEGVSPRMILDPADYENFAAVKAAWRPITEQWERFVEALTDEQCLQVIDYRNTRGHGFSLLLVDILQHVINHATEHRSQLTPLLTHLDVPTEPLDYMFFLLRR